MTQIRTWAAVLALAATGTAADALDKFDEAMEKLRAKDRAEQDRNLEKIRRESGEKMRSKRAEERAATAAQLARFADPQTLALLTAALDDPDAEVRENAARSLWTLHATSASAQPALRARLDDVPGVAVAAAGALEAMGVKPSELVAARRRVLERGTPWERFVAAQGLVGHVPAVELFPAFMDQYLDDARSNQGDPMQQRQAEQRRQAALEALQELARKQDRSMIPPLVESLRRMTPGRDKVLGLLALYAPPPDDWRDILVGALGVPDPDVQRAALLRLRDLKDEADVRAWVPAVARLVQRRGVASYAAGALAVAGPLAADHAPALVRLLQSGTEEERKDAAEALGSIGDRKRPAPQAVRERVGQVALPALQNALREDPMPQVRLAAALAINQLQVDPAVAATALAEAATSPAEDPSVRQMLLSRLGNRGGEAKAAEPMLAAYLPRSGDQRDLVASALEKIRDGKVNEPTLGPKLAVKDADAEQRAHSYLRARGVEFEQEQFAKALYEADLQVVAAFLDAGMSPRSTFAYGETTLRTLLSGGGCRTNVRPTADNVRETLELLLTSGADVNQPDGARITPLMHAISSGCDRIVVRTLVKAGARLGDKDMNGFTAYESGLAVPHDGLDELLAAGYRMPAARAKELLAAYADNAKALPYIRKAAAAPAARPKPAGAVSAKPGP